MGSRIVGHDCATSLSLFTFMNWRRQWQPTPVLLPGKSHGQESLVGCSPWGREELDTTERLHFPFSLSWIGEGNGNPLQCSCLENPKDGGAWRAAVYGVSQSQTRLKWLSSSSYREPTPWRTRSNAPGQEHVGKFEFEFGEWGGKSGKRWGLRNMLGLDHVRFRCLCRSVNQV